MRFEPEVGVFAALADDAPETLAAMSELVRTTGDVAFIGDPAPAVPGAITVSVDLCVQMVEVAPTAGPELTFAELGDGDAREMLGIAMALAVTFAAYGLVRRFAPVASLPGLTIETAVLLLPAIGIIFWQAESHGGTSFGHSTRTDLLLPLSGVLTAVPLLMFAVAARRMDYSTLGFVQFLSPTIVFFLGLFVFHEPLRQIQLLCFVLIWAAAGLFVWDLWARRGRRSG